MWGRLPQKFEAEFDCTLAFPLDCGRRLTKSPVHSTRFQCQAPEEKLKWRRLKLTYCRASQYFVLSRVTICWSMEHNMPVYSYVLTYKPLVIYKWSMRTSAEFKAIHLNITDKIIIIHIINGLIRVPPNSCPDIFATFPINPFFWVFWFNLYRWYLHPLLSHLFSKLKK